MNQQGSDFGHSQGVALIPCMAAILRLGNPTVRQDGNQTFAIVYLIIRVQ